MQIDEAALAMASPESDSVRPDTATSATHAQALSVDGTRQTGAASYGGEGESALPEDVKEEALERESHHWDKDPANARNWSFRKKWLMVFIVRLPISFNKNAVDIDTV